MMASGSREAEMQRSVGISIEVLLYAAVFAIAVLLRSVMLGTSSLSGYEVASAITARNLAASQGLARLAGSPIVYGITAFSFSLFGASNAAARIASAVAGSVLVASPLFFRQQIGRVPTLIMCALLAISPGAIAASRQLNGVIFSVLALVLMIAAFVRYLNHRKSIFTVLAGIALGAAISSDSGAILVILTLGLGILFAYLTDDEGELSESGLLSIAREFPWKLFALGFAGTLLILSTGFFLSPGGLGAAADQLGELAAGLLRRSFNTPWLGLVLSVYELDLLIFGVAGIWVCSQSERAWLRFIAGWGFASVILTTLYPGALPLHALWSIIPLTALSAQAISALMIMTDRSPSWASWLHAGGIIAFVSMIFASLSQYLRNPRLTPLGAITGNPEAGIPVDLVLTVVWLILLIILWLTVASMWEPRTAWKGLGLGILITVVVVTFGQSTSLATVRSDSPYELYNLQPPQPGLHAMVQTMEEIGNLAVGDPQDASITVQGIPDSIIGWALRDFHNIAFIERADPTIDSVMVITPIQGADPALGSSYVGQDRVIAQAWLPSDLSLPDFLKWVLYRTAPNPASEERVILWVREDIYLLASDEPNARP